MITDSLYDVAEQSGVEIVRFPLPESESMSLPCGAGCVIGLDNTRHMTRAEECVHLGHELGHCVYGGFYTKATPFDVVERHEYRADAWFIQRNIPPDRLFSFLRSGYSPAEVAEQMGVTEEYIFKAYYYYKECLGLRLG